MANTFTLRLIATTLKHNLKSMTYKHKVQVKYYKVSYKCWTKSIPLGIYGPENKMAAFAIAQHPIG